MHTVSAMEKGEKRYFYPLTNLQIGDMQSYLSFLTIFMPPNSKKFLILVDCRPWLTDSGMKPTHLWQLMVTKSRRSPFANSKVKRPKKSFSKRFDSRKGLKFDHESRKLSRRWFPLIDILTKQKKAFMPIEKLKDSFLINSDLHDTFYGFIIFEVQWDDVRGINYVNELLTDTSMAVEAKIMKRWEFDSAHKASTSLSSWFVGTNHERSLLLDFLSDGSKSGDEFYDAHENIPSKDDDNLPKTEFRTPPISAPRKRRKISNSKFITDESDDHHPTTLPHPSESTSDISESTHYKDVMILFRFNDHDLPFILKNKILEDRRLLTLLEYGLPSWVIFLQSYPIVCKLYRPWMCPLARILYILVSVATMLIGFYDLYKNVPILKATAAKLCGPFFNWIESFEMISRIRCLGTMLFLHNFEIAVEWFVMASQTAKTLLMVLTRPLVGPVVELVELLEPMRMVCLEVVGGLASIAWDLMESARDVVMGMVNLVLWPFWVVLSVMWSIATSIIYPTISMISELLVLPARLVNTCINILATLFSSIWDAIVAVRSAISPLFQILPRSEVSSIRDFEIPIWRSLCIKVFHAIKAIMYGFIAFFATCNRHRLSISNHFQEMAHAGYSDCRRILGSRSSLKSLQPSLWYRKKEEPDRCTVKIEDEREIPVEIPGRVRRRKPRKRNRHKAQTTSEPVHT